MQKKVTHITLWMLFAAAMLFLTMNRHSRSGYFNYHSEIWGDKAGYYMYLPGALKYGFDATVFPDSMDVKTGNGFQLDLASHRVITKYTYGTALMQLPFYIFADLFAPLLGQPADGFAPLYHKAINVAAVFYLVLGMLFLFYFLRDSYPRKVIILVLFSLLFGTNLFYYAVDETGMSHVYSFFLFSALLLMSQQWFAMGKLQGRRLLVFSFTASLIVLVRPTNALFVLFAVMMFLQGKTDWQARILPLLRPGKLALIFIPAVLLFVPQIVYWSYAYGGTTVYSYSGEGFNWLNPQPHITLFSPNNGLLVYTPLFLLILFSMLLSIRNHQEKHSWIKIILLFLIITYVFSCWWTPEFGCGFGSRNYVEFYAVFALPIACLYGRMLKQPALIQVGFWVVVLAMVAFNMKMTYTWDECFYGVGYWDWQEYFGVVFAPTK